MPWQQRTARARRSRVPRAPFDLFIAIIDQGQQLLRAIAHGKNIVHGGTPLTQQALEVGIPLTHASELARVEGDAIAIGTKLVRAILKGDAGIRKRIGNVAQFAIDGSHTGKLGHGAVHGIERSTFGGKRCMGIVSCGNQYLGMFGARQQFLEFLILARQGRPRRCARGRNALPRRDSCAREASSTRRTSLAAARDALKQAR